MKAADLEQMGRAALLPGMRFLRDQIVELLNQKIADFEGQLQRLQTGELPRRGRRPNIILPPAAEPATKVVTAIDKPKRNVGWPEDPIERKAEYQRRVAKGMGTKAMQVRLKELNTAAPEKEAVGATPAPAPTTPLSPRQTQQRLFWANLPPEERERRKAALSKKMRKIRLATLKSQKKAVATA